MSRKIPASRRIVIKNGGAHVHTLGTDNVATTWEKFSSAWLHKKVSQTDEKDLLIPGYHSSLASHPPPTTGTKITTITPTTFAGRYGRCKRIIHYGKTSTVRLYEKTPTQVFAIKVSHHPHYPGPEHIITPGLRHPHIVEVIDVFWDSREDLCLVMEYCAGGDLLSLLVASASRKLEKVEADCFFKQLMRGVEYLHENRIAHRNLKLESILLTSKGCVKITGFDRAQSVVSSDSAEDFPQLQSVSSSWVSPYRAPEEYTTRDLDARKADVWAAGIIYLAIRTGHLFWNVAREENDSRFALYVKERAEESFEPIEDLADRSCRNVIYAMLDPNCAHRITASEVSRSEWVQRIVLCDAVQEAYNMPSESG